MEVLVLFGSASDMHVGAEIVKLFDHFKIDYEMHIASAHRTPEKAVALVKKAERSGAKAIIAGAGMSAHLAGVVASVTLLPVIGIPVDGGPLNGLDALLSTVNMPGGAPVATVSMGKAGGVNAALLAARIIALSRDDVAAALAAHKQKQADDVEEADMRINAERGR
jgi:phosphoribosylaminoimidazole carboxylase PurE protein